jgi:UDP-N-acetylmuramate dehydrogenase
VIDPAARRDLEAALRDRITFDVPMSRHTALRIGGPADALATPADRGELARLLAVCSEYSLPRTLLGAGFNVLVRDAGIEGVVIVLRKLRALEERPGPGVYAEAGVSHSQVTRFCTDRGLSGLEFTAGIPGTVGGWLAMNAGIGTREMQHVVRAVEIVPGDGGAERTIPREDLEFRYRGLHGLPAGAVLVAALFAVEPSTREAVKAEVTGLLDARAETQPLNVPSCGSVFRNPSGDHAGRLIEAAGLKGERVGGAQISEVHANFIANTGGATADDVLALIERAQKRVRDTAGIELETEVKVMGRAA